MRPLLFTIELMSDFFHETEETKAKTNTVLREIFAGANFYGKAS